MESGPEVKEEGYRLAEQVLNDGNSNWDAERFIEQIWHELEGAFSRSRIKNVLVETAPAYEHARIKTYVPILLRRDVLLRLRNELKVEQRPKRP